MTDFRKLADGDDEGRLAILRSMLVVGLTVMLTAFAVTLSYQDPAAVVSGQIVDSATLAAMDAFCARVEQPFVAIVLVAFVACVVSAQTCIGRATFGMPHPLGARYHLHHWPLNAVLPPSVLIANRSAIEADASSAGARKAARSSGATAVTAVPEVSHWRCRAHFPDTRVNFDLSCHCPC